MSVLSNKVKSVCMLHDTRDVNEVENSFITTLIEQTQSGENVSSLSQAQVKFINQLYKKNFLPKPTVNR